MKSGRYLTVINGHPIKRRNLPALPYNPHLKIYLKYNRKARILPEVLFWKEVRNKKFHSLDFDRQRIIGNYIVDFYVKTLGLVIEIDGNSHDDKEEYDTVRQSYMESVGLHVIRFSNHDLLNYTESVMTDLENYIITHFS